MFLGRLSCQGTRRSCFKAVTTVLKPSAQTSQFPVYLHTCFQYLSRTPSHPKLSPQEVNQILRQHQTSYQWGITQETVWDEALITPSTHAITSVDSNQLASNSPIEDKLSIAKCKLTTGFLFGVFDGHGGSECSQVVSKRLFDYIAASLLSKSQLRQYISDFEEGKCPKLIETYHDSSNFIKELNNIYDQSLLTWCKYLLNIESHDFNMEDCLSGAFKRLDEDISFEIESNQGNPIFDVLVRIGMSGSVACVAHVDGPHLHVANTGDCGAVLGQLDHRGGWLMKRLSKDHNWENPAEVKRVLSEHPAEESKYVIQNQRLLGMLMPFRAFGDLRFKWDFNKQEQVVAPFSGPSSVVRKCRTPPYLTATPDIMYHRLKPEDRYLVLGSDGLWESLTAVDVITLVGEYTFGRQALQPLVLPSRKVQLGEISRLLEIRQKGLTLKPCDNNAATHLIRYCIGGTESGLDHRKISHSLTLPRDVRRYFRDDISIHVIYFDSNFLKICPIEL